MALLDVVTTAQGAWGLRKLDDDYAGNCIRVRRDNDDAEANIGFSGSDLDTAALASHVGANSGYVVTWYDQSGNTRNFTQATEANQPRIIASGVLEVLANGRPTLNFNGDRWLSASWTNTLTAQTVFAVCTLVSDGDAYGRLYNQSDAGDDNAGSGVYIPMIRVASGAEWSSYYGAGSGFYGNVSSVPYDEEMILSCIHSGTGVSNRMNGGTASTGTFTLNKEHTRRWICEGTDGSSWKGFVSEVIDWPSDKSANYSTIYDSQYDYYIAQPLDHFTIEAADGVPLRSQATGVAFDVVVTARGADESVVTGFSDTVDLSATGGTLAVGSGTSGAFTDGVLTISVRIDANSEAVTLSVEDTDTGLYVGDSAEIAIWDLDGGPSFTFSSPTGDTSVQIHRSPDDGFVPGTEPPGSPDDLILDLGWDLDGSATDPGKDEAITWWHLANNVSGYGHVEGPGEAWAYDDISIGLLGDSFKVALGASLPPDAADTEIDDYFQAKIGTHLDFQDASGFFVRDNRGLEISLRDLARLAKLVLNKGTWGATRVLPASIFGTFGAAGTLFGEINVPNTVPRTAGADANGNYLSIATIGGGADQTAEGRGSYGFGVWLNGVDSTTDPDRLWPDLPTNTLVGIGIFHIVDWVVFPDEELVICFVSDVGPLSHADFNDLLFAIIDGITGDPVYADEDPGVSWTTATAADAGLTQADIDDFDTALGGGGSLVVVRRGRLVHSTGGIADSPGNIASASKPFLALTALARFSEYTLIDTIAAGSTSYTDDDTLEEGETYYYRVVFDDGAPMFESNQATVVVGEVVFILPDSVVARGGWTDTLDVATDAAVLAGVQEAAAPDAKSPKNPTSSDVVKFALEDLTYQGPLHYRIKKQIIGLGKTLNFTIQLRTPDGSSLVDVTSTWTRTNVGTSTEEYEEDLTGFTLVGGEQVWCWFEVV